MKDARIDRIASRYQLKLAGVNGRVRTPFWINWDEPPWRLDAPLRGKGTAEEIATTIATHLGTRSPRTWSPDAVRYEMRQLGLGIDGSGFVFHVLDRYLRDLDLGGLAHHLLIYQAELEEAVQRHPERQLHDAKITSLPKWLPLSAVCELWDKPPAMICNNRRLTDTQTSRRIDAVRDIRPGDLIGITSHEEYVAIVSAVGAGFLEYFESQYEPGGLGGVRKVKIELTRPDAGLGEQPWGKLHHLDDEHDGVWRLHCLDALHGRP